MRRISEEKEEKDDKVLSESPRSSHQKKKKKKKKTKKSIVQSYSDVSDQDSDKSTLSTSAVNNETDRKYLESDEDEEKVIEKIRRKRAKLLAHLPEEKVEMRAPREEWVGAQGSDETRGSRENMVPITCFQQVRIFLIFFFNIYIFIIFIFEFYNFTEKIGTEHTCQTKITFYSCVKFCFSWLRSRVF